MGWDCLNRMISLTNSSGTESYNYRADGMRVSKSGTSSGTVYRYDGQMGIEDVDAGSSAAVTDYALGARGIDAISKTVGSNTTVVYPIYDAHGNMMGDVSRDGSSFSVNDKRSFDAWGNIRQGASSGDPKGRYCANLGHKQDDESGLVYMRARYYEPTSGRFISQDPEMQAVNWFVYCNSNPTNCSDLSGEIPLWYLIYGSVSFASGMTLAVTAFALMVVAKTPSDFIVAFTLACLAFGLIGVADASFHGDGQMTALATSATALAFAGVLAMEAGAVRVSAVVGGGLAFVAVLAAATYSVILLGYIEDANFAGSDG